MTGPDLQYVEELLARGLVGDPVLELGAGYGGATCRERVEASGRRYVATDVGAGPGVDVVADFESGNGCEAAAARGPFGTVLVLNVLEHVLEPAAVLDNALRILVPGGTLVTVTPCAWPVHRWPVDCARLLPDWHRRYAATRGLALDEATFRYVGYGPVGAFRSRSGEERLPPAGSGRALHRAYSRLVHGLFFTFGRETQHEPRIAVGAVYMTKR
jgi:SAM-dependent methyltransferase